mmetsp:Transcript_29756/g.30894  ORF Transcript_29756/g.30894 Transcript_29756/m.30894 type:complete len:220 (+) Transcript_29756:607-1266(+)
MVILGSFIIVGVGVRLHGHLTEVHHIGSHHLVTHRVEHVGMVVGPIHRIELVVKGFLLHLLLTLVVVVIVIVLFLVLVVLSVVVFTSFVIVILFASFLIVVVVALMAIVVVIVVVLVERLLLLVVFFAFSVFPILSVLSVLSVFSFWALLVFYVNVDFVFLSIFKKVFPFLGFVLGLFIVFFLLAFATILCSESFLVFSQILVLLNEFSVLRRVLFNLL